MLVAQLGVLVLEKIMKIENAVGIGTQPLRKAITQKIFHNHFGYLGKPMKSKYK